MHQLLISGSAAGAPFDAPGTYVWLWMVAPPTSATLACSALVSSTFWLFKSLHQANGASRRQAVNRASKNQQSLSLQGNSQPQVQRRAQPLLRLACCSGAAASDEMRRMGKHLPEQATQSDA